jgi:hypothetical protein
LIASSFDGQLHHYDRDMRLTVKRAAPDGNIPHGVSIDPSGHRVAVGCVNARSVSILDARVWTQLIQ